MLSPVGFILPWCLQGFESAAPGPASAGGADPKALAEAALLRAVEALPDLSFLLYRQPMMPS